MERAEEEALEIRDGGVDLRQPLVHRLGRRGAGLDFETLLEVQNAVGLPAVGADAEPVAQATAERSHGVAVHAVHGLQGEKSGALVGAVLHRHEHGALALGAASPLAAPGAAAHERVVQLHMLVLPDAQHVVPVAVRHGAADLVQHELRGSPGHADHLAQPLRGDAALVGRGEVDRGEPLGQGKPRVLEQRPRRRGGLERAFPALPDGVPLQHVGAVVAAPRTAKAVPPANSRRGFEAGALRSEALRPFLEAGLGVLAHGFCAYCYEHV